METQKTEVVGLKEVEDTMVKKTGRFLFFKTEWWEVVKTTELGNDIIINTEHPIRRVIFNGRIINSSD